MNQYSATPFGGRTNDANGNLTIAGSEYYIYDYRNQLLGAYHFDGSGFTQTFGAKYDCFGRRIEKTGTNATSRYYYAGAQEIEEQDDTDATVATYVWAMTWMNCSPPTGAASATSSTPTTWAASARSRQLRRRGGAIPLR